MKKSVYLDSTIPSHLCDERASLKTYIEVTQKWWAEERRHFTLRISEESIIELSDGDYSSKEKTLSFISGIPLCRPRQGFTK